MRQGSAMSEEWDARFKRDDGLYHWDRQENESGKAYAAFCVYRDMGKGRSVHIAYWTTKGRLRDDPARFENGKIKPAIKRWQIWMDAYTWLVRASQYDLYLELMTRREREAKHLGDLFQFRERQRSLAAATTEAAVELLKKANKRLRDLEPSDIPPGALPAFFRAAAAVAEASAGSEAQALAVDELMRLLDAGDSGQ